MDMITDTLRLAKKDLMLEFRKKETLFSMALFSFASVLIFSTLFNLITMPLEAKHAVSAASVWFIITFTVMLGLTSVFSRETKRNSIYSLLSLSIKPQTIFLSKLVYLGVILAFIEVITLILAVVFLRVDIQGDFFLLCAVLGIGTFDLAVAGCIVSFLTIYAKSKTLAVPILFFPLILPSILIATQATTNVVLFDEPWYVINNTLLLLIHAVTIIVVALLFVDELIGE
ncbi:MAG: heme exporter protein CcmB [Candidatus Hodarchaeales archaeon]|jgi:ABC-type transport system involved in cytochrome c biogenesis permease component